MSYCLNPSCQQPNNGDERRVCQSCGTKLLIHERFRAVKPIAKGSSGFTYLGVEGLKTVKRQCVIKQFLPLEGKDSKRLEHILTERAIRLHELGTYPLLPSLIANHYQEGRYYIIQEFIEGQNLAQELQQIGYFFQEKVQELLTTLLPTLQFLHSHSVIHYDIKPQNIIRKSDGDLALVDLGGISTSTINSQTNLILGSAEYAAPEQASGKAMPASDLYSLGMVCLNLLTGDSPFTFQSSSDGLKWRDLLPEGNLIADELGLILDRLTHQNLEDRYQTTEEVLVDLKRWLRGSQATFQCLHTLQGHSGVFAGVLSVDISSDGDTIASGSEDTSVKLWSLSKAKETCTLTKFSGFQAAVRAVAFIPNSLQLASASANNTIKIVNLKTLQEEAILNKHTKAVTSLSVSPNGKVLASGSDDTKIKLWDLNRFEELQTLSGHSSYISSLAFSLNGKSLISSSHDQRIGVWDVTSGQLSRMLPGHSSAVRAVTFSPQGRLFASAGNDKLIKLWDWETLEEIKELHGHEKEVTSIAFSPNGKVLASGSDDQTIKLWEVATGEELGTLEGHQYWVYTLAFSPDGKTLISGSADKCIRLWQINALG